MIRPSVEWKPFDRFSVTVGADIFTGNAEGLFGQYANPRTCAPAPDPAVAALVPGLPPPASSECQINAPPGLPSRIFIRFRYAFGLNLP